MASGTEYNNEISKINDYFTAVDKISVEKLVREDELGHSLSFKASEEVFKRLFQLFDKTRDTNFHDIPYSQLTAFSNHLETVIKVIDSIVRFKPSNNNPVNQRTSLMGQLENAYEHLYESSIPIQIINHLSSNNINSKLNEANSLIAELEKKKNDANKQSDEYLRKLDETLESAERAAAKVGVTKHAHLFQNEAQTHYEKAKFWLKWTIIVLGAIAATALTLMFIFPRSGSDNHEIIQYSIAKIVVLSTLFYGLSICNKNYKAHKHNETLNKHRQNALSTFETFVNAAGNDDQTKNAVLLEATRTIFSSQQTGYLNNDKENESSNKIVEIFKSVADNKT
jgi:hypothetical protein